MSIYEETNVARALLYWAKNNNGHEAYYLEDRMYAVADGDMVIILTADSYDEAIRKAKARHTHAKGEWIKVTKAGTVPVEYICSLCRRKIYDNYELTTPIDEFYPFCHCGADMRKGGAE